MGVAINPLNLRGNRVTADMYSQRIAKFLESIINTGSVTLGFCYYMITPTWQHIKGLVLLCGHWSRNGVYDTLMYLTLAGV